MDNTEESHDNGGTSQGLNDYNNDCDHIIITKGENRNVLLDTAFWYRASGLSIIPLIPRSKRPLVEWKKCRTTLPTEEEVRQWWKENPDANIGIITGQVSGLCVIEIDDQTVLYGHDIPFTPQSKSGGKGLPHIYCRYIEGIPSFSWCPDGKEVFSFRSDGRYIVAPPSILENGGVYTWIDGCALGDIALADHPEWLYEYLGEVVKQEFEVGCQ